MSVVSMYLHILYITVLIYIYVFLFGTCLPVWPLGNYFGNYVHIETHEFLILIIFNLNNVAYTLYSYSTKIHAIYC